MLALASRWSHLSPLIVIRAEKFFVSKWLLLVHDMLRDDSKVEESWPCVVINVSLREILTLLRSMHFIYHVHIVTDCPRVVIADVGRSAFLVTALGRGRDLRV